MTHNEMIEVAIKAIDDFSGCGIDNETLDVTRDTMDNFKSGCLSGYHTNQFDFDDEVYAAHPEIKDTCIWSDRKCNIKAIVIDFGEFRVVGKE